MTYSTRTIAAKYRKGVPDRRVIVCHQPQETGQRIVPGANHEVIG